MDEFPSKISTQTSTHEEAAPGTRTVSWKFITLDVGFVKSILGILMIVEIVLGLLVWALVADSHYQDNPAYGWVLFVALFCWIATVIFFVIYLFQLHLKMKMISWAIVNLAYNVAATILYITGFITCSAAVQPVYWYVDYNYNKRAAASFFACLVMLAYGASCFFSFRMWRGNNSNAATSQAAGPNSG